MNTSIRSRPLRRNNVTVAGAPDGRPMVLVHGFGCDQRMWRHVVPAFEATHRIVLLDLVGAGGSDLDAYDEERHGASLQGHADDVLEVAAELGLRDAILVGHSVSAMIGVLAHNRAPEVFTELVLIGPSPRYVDDEGYTGGFTREAIEGLLDTLEANYLGWSATMAPVIMGVPERPELAGELTASFCRTDPDIAASFARTTFLSDNRADLDAVRARTLVMQCSQDAIASEAVGEYVHAHIAGSEYVRLEATGHCPHLSAPEETVAALRRFLS